MGGAGPAADSAGNIYLLDGNGTFDTSLDVNGFPGQRNFGNAFLQISMSSGLAVADYFANRRTRSRSPTPIPISDQAARSSCPILVDGTGQIGSWRSARGKTHTSTSSTAPRWESGMRRPTRSTRRSRERWRAGSSPCRRILTAPCSMAPRATRSRRSPSATPGSCQRPRRKSARTFAYPGTTPGISRLHCECNCLGSRKRQPRGAARLRRPGSVA